MKFWNSETVKSLVDQRVPIKKFWFHDDAFKSAFFDASSVLIPGPERYIIGIVAPLKLRGGDRDLVRRKEILLEEEGAHAKVHDRYNAMLESEGYDIARYQAWPKSVQDFFDRHLSLKSRLAMCAAVEHFTASISIYCLRNRRIFDGIDERMKKVWLWHFMEEVDHRSALFDIYRNLGGGYLRRASIMAVMLFASGLHHFWTYQGLLWQSGKFFDPKTRWHELKFLITKDAFVFKMAMPFLKYLMPWFHPKRIDFTPSIEHEIHRRPIENQLAEFFPVV